MQNVIALVAVMAFVGSQAGRPPSVSPFVGSWTANLAKSRQSPNYPFQSAKLQIGVDGDIVRMSNVVVNASGMEQRAAQTFRSDGTETPVTLTPGVSIIARWVGTHVLAMIAKKNDQLIALETYEVSADGRTLTARSSGRVEHVIVFERD
jgi:hypothetical protein